MDDETSHKKRSTAEVGLAQHLRVAQEEEDHHQEQKQSTQHRKGHKDRTARRKK